MMKLEYRPCSCPNQHQVATGETCEICQGIIGSIVTEEIQAPDNDCFGNEYFEDLEYYLENMIHAA